MRVLVVSPYFYPEGGGLEKYAYRMTKDLSRDSEVVVLCSTKERKYKEENLDGIKVIRKRPNLIISNTPIRLLLPFELLSILKKGDFELIIAHTPVPFYADAASLVAKLLKKPIIIVYHVGELKKGSWTDILAQLYEKTLEKITLRNAKIIAVSRYVQKILWRKGFNSEVKYPKLDEIFLAVRPNFKGDEILFVGQLGRFHKWKNLELLLKALVLVKNKIPNVKLVIIGEGDLKEHYVELSKELDLENNVKFLGFVSDEELIKHYKKAKLLVLPSSKSEAFGMVVLEALSLGTPVVVSKMGEFPRIVEDGKGGLLAELNEKELADKILNLLVNEKIRRKMGVIGYRRAKRFSP